METPHTIRRVPRTGRRSPSLVAAAVLVAGWLAGAASPAAADGVYEQVFQLRPGWNAIFLEVDPVDPDIESVFAGIPIESVWSWAPPETRVDFVQDPADGLLDVPGWLHYVPRPLPQSVLNNLFGLLANRAYLVELGGTTPVTWRVAGRPSLAPPIMWPTDSFHLTGFKVDPALPPTFANYFAPSEAHADQPIYRLGTDGFWTLVTQPAGTQIASGEAYWVYTKGASAYQGPLEVDVELGGSLEFGASLDRDTLVVRNISGFDTNIKIRRLDSTNAVPIAYLREEDGQTSWPQLPSPLSTPSVNEQEHLFELGVRRAAIAADRLESILEVSNGLGSRILVPVGVTAFDIDAAGATLRAPGGDEGSRVAANAATTTSSDLAGLWIGDVEVEAVSESQVGGTVPTPTGKPFSFRILLHVDGSGATRLLKEVIQMWEEGTMVPSAEDPTLLEVGEPGRYVLLTDDTLLSDFEGATLRDGVPVGYRVSSAAYDFEGQWVDMDGTFGLGGVVGCTLILESEAPTNPFRHEFHPDHDNRDAQFLNFEEEAFTVTREMELDFADGATEADPPGWGNTRIGGTFRESISGLHRNTVFVAGTFELTRVSATPVLNQ